MTLLFDNGDISARDVISIETQRLAGRVELDQTEVALAMLLSDQEDCVVDLLFEPSSRASTVWERSLKLAGTDREVWLWIQIAAILKDWDALGGPESFLEDAICIFDSENRYADIRFFKPYERRTRQRRSFRSEVEFAIQAALSDLNSMTL